MAELAGDTLGAVIAWHARKRRKIAIAHGAHIIIEAGNALGALKSEPPELVPRDVSPETILISKQGEVGLASFDLEHVRNRVSTHAVGFSYLAPETASGARYDRRIEVFALGSILWEMLSGRRLFIGNTDYQTVELVRAARVDSVASLNADVDRDLDSIVRTALAKSPEERFPTTAAFADALADYVAAGRLEISKHDIAAVIEEMYAHAERRLN